MRDGDTNLGGSSNRFTTTVGEIVSGVADPYGSAGPAALELLCHLYWKPLYGTVRMIWAKSNEDAKDLTQAFFLWMIEDGCLQKYSPQKGRFRSYLKILLKHFLQNRERALRQLKRGGGKFFLQLDAPDTSFLENTLSDPRSADPGEVF